MAKNKYGGINDMPAGWTKVNHHKRVYSLWFDILRRCYDEGQKARRKGAAYEGCKVCDEWFSLGKFYSDIKKLPGYREWKEDAGMSIDKDLLSNGNKEYGPKNCCFVPISVNVAEKNRRNPTIKKAQEARKTNYALTKGGEVLKFGSEKEACAYLGVHNCTVSSCFRRNSKCKGYTIAKMDKK